jgi:hypothetical protein
MDQLFTFLYPLVAVIGATAYFPQIMSLALAKSDPVGVSIRSYIMWMSSNLIVCGYAYFSVHDPMMCILGAFNVCMNISVIVLTIRARYFIFGSYNASLQEFFMALFKEPAPVKIKTDRV